MEGNDGVMEWKSQAGLLYADCVCLMASSEEDMKVIKERVNACWVEYGLKVMRRSPSRWEEDVCGGNPGVWQGMVEELIWHE